MEPPSTSLRDIADGVVGWVSDEYADAPVHVKISIPPGTFVAADATAMDLVFRHLLSNAVRFSPPGEKVIVVGRTDGDLVTVSITNATAELTKEQREVMFKPFIRIEDDHDGAAPRAGMGLHVVRRLIDLYGGTVGVSSSGNIVTFTLQLPAAVAPERVVDLREEQIELE